MAAPPPPHTEPSAADTGTPIVEHLLQIGGLRQHVAIAGPPDGPAVLLLHGFPDRGAIWRPVMRRLAAAGMHAVAPDLRGYGDTDRPAAVGQYAIEHVLADVLGLLDALEIEQAAVVGHDWGAVVAWELAREHPTRVRQLVPISVGHPLAFRAGGLEQLARSSYVALFSVPGLAERLLPQDGWRRWRTMAWGGAGVGDEPSADAQIRDLSRPGALTAGLNWYRANIARGALLRRTLPGGPARSRVRCPVLGVWSSRDPALTETQMTASARYVDGPWQYRRLDGVDHWVPQHAPEALGTLLVDFLAPGVRADD